MMASSETRGESTLVTNMTQSEGDYSFAYAIAPAVFATRVKLTWI